MNRLNFIQTIGAFLAGLFSFGFRSGPAARRPHYFYRDPDLINGSTASPSWIYNGHAGATYIYNGQGLDYFDGIKLMRKLEGESELVIWEEWEKTGLGKKEKKYLKLHITNPDKRHFRALKRIANFHYCGSDRAKLIRNGNGMPLRFEVSHIETYQPGGFAAMVSLMEKGKTLSVYGKHFEDTNKPLLTIYNCTKTLRKRLLKC